MRHMLSILFLLLATYAGLYSIGSAGRAIVWKFVRPHVFPIIAIVLVLVLALMALFYTGSIHFL